MRHVFTQRLDQAWRVAGALRVGMVAVNDAPEHGVGHFPSEDGRLTRASAGKDWVTRSTNARH